MNKKDIVLISFCIIRNFKHLHDKQYNLLKVSNDYRPMECIPQTLFQHQQSSNSNKSANRAARKVGSSRIFRNIDSSLTTT